MTSYSYCCAKSIAAAVLLAAGFSSSSSATVLTFDIAGIANAGVFNKDYGNRVTAATTENFTYGTAGGFTPNIAVTYGPPAATIQTWTTGYGDLANVILDRNPSLGRLQITLTADPGYSVRLHSWDMAAFPQLFGGIPPAINEVTVIVDGVSAASFPWQGVEIPLTGHRSFDFSATPFVGREITVAFDSSNYLGIGAADDVCFDNIMFSQSAVAVTRLAITGGPATVAEHSTNGYACTAEFSDGTPRDVSAEAQWSITEAWATPPNWRFEDGTNLVTGEICTPTTNITIQAIYRGQPATKPVTVMNVARFVRSLRVAEATTSSLSLNWVLEDPSGRDGVGFQVEHRKFGEDTWAGQSAGEARFTITGLEEGTYYEVRVRAVSGACADDWAYLEPITSTSPGIYYANDACIVYRFADLQLGRQVPESAWAFFWEQVAEAAVEKGFGLILAPLGIAVDYVSAALTPAIMAKVVGQLFTEDDPTVSVVSVVPTEDLSARAKLKVARGSDIWVMLAVDTRGKADVVDGEVYLESLSQYGNRIAPRQRLLSGQEAREKLQPGFIYVFAPKSPLSSDTVWTTLWVEGGYLATFGGHHDQLAYVVVDPSAGNVAISDVAELCMTGVVGSSNEVTAAVVSTGALTGLPSGVYPQMALNILPDNLVFDSEAILTIRRQPNMGDFTTDAVIARNSDGVWDFLPTTYHANYTADLADDYWTASVNHPCVFALCERETFGVSSRLDGESLIVSWNTRSNLNYTLLSSTSLVSGGWQPVPGAVNVPGTGEPVSVTNSRTTGATFFKVRID